MRKIKDETWPRPGALLAALSLLSLFILFQLYRHPETAFLFFSLPSPEAFACNLRCLGITPFLQVFGEAGKALLLIFISFSFLYAISRTVLRILRTLAFIDRVERNAVPFMDIPRLPFLENVTVFEDRMPLAFTGGFLKPRVFVSTKLMEALEEKELRAVILHEFHHQNMKDPLKGLVVSFISDFLFFLPISRFLKKAHSLTAEMTADAHSVNLQADPVDLAVSLLKVQKVSGRAASWFLDPATERAKRLLGERSKMPLPFKRIFLSLVLLAVSAFIAFIPVKKNISLMFINHDNTCVLRTSRK
jgi:hypothetical protein